MEEILHFAGQRRINSKTRHFTVQPAHSESDNENNEQQSISPLIKKKSHFSTQKDGKVRNFNLQECELSDDETQIPLSNI